MFSAETVAAWSYDASDGGGQDGWASADSSFSKCGSGDRQSPIDLYQFRVASESEPLLTPQFKAGRLLLRNTGEYIRIVTPFGSLMYHGDRVFEVVYAAIHTPSDHHMGGESMPLELQFICRSPDDGDIVGLSLLYKEGPKNEFLAKLADNLPKDAGKETLTASSFNLGDALPRDVTQYKAGTRVAYPYYTYDGSLTTPPCTEGVKWFVWSKPDHASKEQIDSLRALFPAASNRRVQSAEGRIVQLKTLF